MEDCCLKCPSHGAVLELGLTQICVLLLPATLQLPCTVLISEVDAELPEASRYPITATAVASTTPSPTHHGWLSALPSRGQKAVDELTGATVPPFSS
jgi:hypothetical protein